MADDINFDDEEEEVIRPVAKEKPDSIRNVMFSRGNIIVESTNLDMCYIAHAFQDTCHKYGIDFEECAVLLYIYELGLVNLKLKMTGKEFWLTNYVQKGFLDEDWSHNTKKLYRLSNYGMEIINYISKCMFNKDKYIGKNRITDIDVETRMKSTLTDYFN